MLDQSNFAQTPGTEKHLINTYVSDMVALFQHIGEPIDSQLKLSDATKYAQAIATLEAIKAVTTSNQKRLETHLAAIGGSADHGVKSVWASILGVGAAAINQVRGTKVSKALRDDSTALGLAAISYTMLHATAVGTGDASTAELAKQGLDDVAPLIVRISRVMPEIVLQELRDDGHPVSVSAAEFAKQTTAASWSSQAN